MSKIVEELPEYMYFKGYLICFIDLKIRLICNRKRVDASFYFFTFVNTNN